MSKIITIAIPTFQREQAIYKKTKEYIKLIKQNKLENHIELLILDNCSATYNIFNLLREFQTSDNSKFLNIVRNEKNIGMTKNIIKSMQICKGMFYFFNGDDDPMNYENVGKVIDIIIKNKDKYNVFISGHPSATGYGEIFKNVEINSTKEISNFLDDLSIYYIANGNTFSKTSCLNNLIKNKLNFLEKYPIPQAAIVLQNLKEKDSALLCNFNILTEDDASNNTLTSWSVNYTRFSIWMFYDKEFNLNPRKLYKRHPILRLDRLIKHFLFMSLLYHFSDTENERKDFKEFFKKNKLQWWYMFISKYLVTNFLSKYFFYFVFLLKSLLIKRRFIKISQITEEYKKSRDKLMKSSGNHHWSSAWFEG